LVSLFNADASFFTADAVDLLTDFIFLNADDAKLEL
jgi:hypothetical protein